MTALSQKGKKRRKRTQLLYRNRPYGPILGGKLNPRMSELPRMVYHGSHAMRCRGLIRKLIKARSIQ